MAANILVQSYINQFNVLYEGEAWFGESYVEKLKYISDSQAFNQPEALKSVAQLVAHVIYWRTPLIKRLEGDFKFRNTIEDEDNWQSNEQLQTVGWTNLKAELANTQQKILSCLQKMPESFLKEEYAEGYSIQRLIEGIIHHDIYHLGQIGLIKTKVQ